MLMCTLLCRGTQNAMKAYSLYKPVFRGLKTSTVVLIEDFYKILCVRRDATQKEIKEAFYELSKRHHPDISGSPTSNAKFQEIASAYEVLGDPSKRMDYDRGLVVPKTTGQPSEFTSKIDLDVLRKGESGSFESNYVKSYNRNLKNTWAARADENISKSAFDYRSDQRRFVCVLYAVLSGLMLGGFAIAKYNEKSVPLMKAVDS